ncbi:TRAP transporter small permease subunit [Desulfocurvus sp. DL9XJH121]
MKILHWIDAMGEWSGLLSRWLGLALSVVVIFEVMSRYLFNKPTIWAFDTAMMLTSMLFLLGSAYVLKHDAQIKVDVLYNLMPKSGRIAVDIIFYLFFFFPFTLSMVWFGAKAAHWSWVAHEISNSSQWGEPIFWWKGMVPLAFLLLTIQGIAEFIRILGSMKQSGGQES